MNYNETGLFIQDRVRIKNFLPQIGIETAREEIKTGLLAPNPFIYSKFFYDKMGSLLFKEITRLKEYYPSRTEKAILKNIAPKYTSEEGEIEIVELGSGDSSKISILLDAADKNPFGKTTYVPVDFSESALKEASETIMKAYPKVEIKGYVADFIHQFKMIPTHGHKRLTLFLGSTIGNFSEKESKELLSNIALGLNQDDSLLVGFDLIKDETILHKAYNDEQGITEEFNKNILLVVNNILNTNFNPVDFDHYAFFNNRKSRIEMHLTANKNCVIDSPHLDDPLSFKKGESIHTENSYKYTRDSILQLGNDSELQLINYHTDKQNFFVVVEFKKKREIKSP